ncbi:MAG TPA: chemotaxis protein CheW [Nitrospiraceae bacterium]|nr:chemotaxis protein CheW [Nitrospiraceae bacterium]
MLRSRHRASVVDRAQQPSVQRGRSLLVFSVGGRQLAAYMEEIAGVRAWPNTMSVPSDTPFVSSLVRLENDCLPVYDLAAKLNRTIDRTGPLCLLVKHEDGPMAVCIDSSIPSLYMADSTAIQEGADPEADITGTCLIGDEQVSIVRLARLGKSRRP